MYETATHVAADFKEAMRLFVQRMQNEGVSVHTMNVLTSAGCTSWEDVAARSELDWLRTKRCGRKTTNEIKHLLAQHDMCLAGQRVPTEVLVLVVVVTEEQAARLDMESMSSGTWAKMHRLD